jgi:hypothetical protein
MREFSIGLLITIATLWLGCPSSPKTCTPGQQISCACPSGSLGAQACTQDGTGYGACLGCGVNSDGGSDAGAGNDGGLDAGTDGGTDGGSVSTNAVFLAIHASPDLAGLRFCFGAGAAADGSDTTIRTIAAIPHSTEAGHPYPGIFPGQGEPLPDIGDSSHVVVTVFLMKAATIQSETSLNPSEKTCDVLIGAHGQGGTLTKSQDYWQLTSFPKGSFPTSSTEILAITGCLPNPPDNTASVARCGGDWLAASGNLAALTLPLDRSIPDSSKMGVQVAHLSAAWDGVFEQLAGTQVTQHALFIASDGTSVVGAPLTNNGINFGQVLPASALAEDRSTTAQIFSFVVRTDQVPPSAPLGSYSQYLASTGPTSPGSAVLPDGGFYFGVGQNYAFVLLGDPSADQQLVLVDGGVNPSYDGHGIHVLAFPTVTSPPPFQ